MLTKLSIGSALFAFALAGAAQGVTLASLVGGGTLVSGDGNITFSNFAVSQTSKLSSDLSLYEVTATDHGFKLESAQFTANSGGLRKFDMSYKVTVTEGTVASAFMDMVGTRQSGKIKIEKDIDGEGDSNESGTFLLTLLSGGSSILHDEDNIAPAQKTLLVDESIRIKKVAALTSVTNGYDYVGVPEPTTLSLLGSGLLGLFFLGRKPRVA